MSAERTSVIAARVVLGAPGARAFAGRALRLLCAGAIGLLGGCGQPAVESGAPEPALLGDDAPELDGKGAPPSPSLKDLGPTGRRVRVIVLPGDASVEVDGFAARRRDGLIEIVGKVGEVRRLRVLKGTQQMEKDVPIEAAERSPLVLDLSTRPAGSGAYPEEAKGSDPTKPPAVLMSDEFE